MAVDCTADKKVENSHAQADTHLNTNKDSTTATRMTTTLQDMGKVV